jgi:hypothetical protein
MKQSMGDSFSSSFVEVLLKHLDADGNGKFTKLEFFRAFSPVIDDDGRCGSLHMTFVVLLLFSEPLTYSCVSQCRYQEDTGISGAQLYALKLEYEKLLEDKLALREGFEDTQRGLSHQMQALEDENQVDNYFPIQPTVESGSSNL